jgi:programmed cell death protein 5
VSEEGYDEELELIRQRKLLEMQRRLEEQRRREEQLKAEARKNEILRAILEPKARERLANLKLVRPELASIVENQLIALAQSGRVEIPISDEVVKELLAELYPRTHRDIRIRIREK